MKRILCAVLTMICLACLGGAFAEAGDDPVVVRVGDYVYSKSLVEFAMRSLADQNGMLWEVLSQEEKEAFREATIQQIVGIGVIEAKLTELGKHDFTAAEEEILRATAQSQYEQMWMTLYQYMRDNDIDVTETQVTQWLNEVGYTQDMFLESVKASERQFRLFAVYCPDVDISDDEIAAYYQEKYVKPDQERYENNVALYEEEMLKLGNAAFFVPEGYKYLKFIQVEYPEKLVQESQPLLMRLNLTDENLVTAFNALALAAATVEELEELVPYRETYFELKAENEAAGEAYLAKLNEALPLAEAVLEKVKKGLAAGQSFELQINLYSGDDTFADPENPGTPFHPESPNWTGDMREAALALQEIGDVSGPVAILDGMYILYYAGDMPGGVHELTDEEFDTVKQNAVYEAKLQKLSDLIAEWSPDYEIETHPELLDLN